jgi:hypothetical protein
LVMCDNTHITKRQASEK